MSKRAIIIGSVLAACLLGACLYYGYTLIKEKPDQSVEEVLLRAVPPDAIVIQQFRSFDLLTDIYAVQSVFFARFCAAENGMILFLNKLHKLESEQPAIISLNRAEALCSVHYTEKNSLNVLLGVNLLGAAWDEETLQTVCRSLGPLVQYKRYNKVGIYQLFDGAAPLYTALVKGFLLVGTTPVVVESSIRHIVSGRSILDNTAFASFVLQASNVEDTRLYINFQQVDKLFGALLNKKMQKHVDFFAKSASWIALDGNITSDKAHLGGYLLADKGNGQYFAAFGNQPAAAPVKTWAYLPASTLLYLSFSLSDFSLYEDAYWKYLEINKRSKGRSEQIQYWEEQKQLSLKQWFSSLYPVEVSLAWVPVGKSGQWLTVVRSNHIQQVKDQMGFPNTNAKQTPEILPNPAAGAFSLLFGSFFAKNDESHYTVIDQCLFLGDKELLESVIAGDPTSYSLYSVMKQSNANGKWMDESGFTFLLQAAAAKDSLTGFTDARIAEQTAKALAPYDQTFMIFQVRPTEGRLYANMALSADTLKPIPISDGTSVAKEDSSIPMATGPFKVYNTASKKHDLLEQRPDSILVLKDEKGKQLWRASVKLAIVDQVVQIDLFKNNKLQMLFASDASLQLLDRLGRVVAPFPIALPTAVRKGPFVFDLAEDKEYLIFLIHTNNSLCRYTKQGIPDPAWTSFTPQDRIEQPPVRIQAPDRDYWVVYGAQKDYVLRANGTAVAVLQKKNRILQNEPIEIQEGGMVLKGKTTEGKILTVHLGTGAIKTRKP